jgi:hypothetical protein
MTKIFLLGGGWLADRAMLLGAGLCACAWLAYMGTDGVRVCMSP